MSDALPPGDAKLRATADKYLSYEIEMLYGALAELDALERAKHDSPKWSQISKNALLESWAVHFRALSEFLYSSRRARPDDVLAQDYFNGAEWEDIRPAPSEELEEVRQRVGKEIAHLTYARHKVKPEDRGWNVGPMTVELTDAVQAFLERVPINRVPSEFRGRCEAWIPREKLRG